MTEGIWAFAVVGGLIFWSLVQGRLARAAQSLRLELAEKGERFLAREDLSPETRRDVEFMLDSAFSRWGMMIFALVAIPIALCIYIFNARKRALVERDYRSMVAEARSDYADLHNLHSRILLANHPLLATLCLLEFSVLAPVGTLIVMAVRREPSKAPVDRYAFISIIEMQEQSLMSRFRHRPLPATCKA